MNGTMCAAVASATGNRYTIEPATDAPRPWPKPRSKHPAGTVIAAPATPPRRAALEYATPGAEAGRRKWPRLSGPPEGGFARTYRLFSVGWPTGTLTSLFTDGEGSTGRWEADRAGTDPLLTGHDERIRSVSAAPRRARLRSPWRRHRCGLRSGIRAG